MTSVWIWKASGGVIPLVFISYFMLEEDMDQYVHSHIRGPFFPPGDV